MSCTSHHLAVPSAHAAEQAAPLPASHQHQNVQEDADRADQPEAGNVQKAHPVIQRQQVPHTDRQCFQRHAAARGGCKAATAGTASQ